MKSDAAYYSQVARYAVLYPGVVVAPMAILTVFRPDFGQLLLIAAVVLGGIIFVALGGDTRSEQAVGSHGGPGLFQRDAPERKGSALTNSTMVFGIGLFGLAGLSLVAGS
jgi:hypothetical protein